MKIRQLKKNIKNHRLPYSKKSADKLGEAILRIRNERRRREMFCLFSGISEEELSFVYYRHSIM